MSIESRYDIEFIAALALREKQIQQNYRPIIAVHKWFARQDMRRLLEATDGKVFTIETIDRLLNSTRIRDFVTR